MVKEGSDSLIPEISSIAKDCSCSKVAFSSLGEIPKRTMKKFFFVILWNGTLDSIVRGILYQ